MADFLSKLNIDSTEHMIRGCGIPYGIVDSTSTSTSFTATVPGINELKNGIIMLLKNGVVTSASGFKININGLGAKPVYSNMAAATAETTVFDVKYTMLFIYDETRVSGGAWICYRGYYSDTTTARGYNDYYFRPYAGSAVYRYKFLMEGADHRLYPITTTNQSSATQVTKSPQTVGLRPWKIWYYNTTSTINAGAVFGAQTIAPAAYMTTAVYNFNASTGTYKWIYLVGSYNKDTDLFTLDSSTTGYYLFVSQNVTPSTSTFTTGKYYILLGASYSTTNYVQLFDVNPFYYFDGTHLIPVESKIAKDEAAAAVQSLDSSISATTGQAISAITITDGKITDSSKISVPTVTDTYSSTSSNAMSGKAVNAALQTLDSSITATTGQAISAITITDGKISANSKINVGETNQNAFSNFKVDAATISASSKTDTFEFYAGQNVTITADATNKKITIDADVDSSVYIVHASSTINGGTITYTTTADWDDAYDALRNGSNVIMQIDSLDMQQTSIIGGSEYYVNNYSSTSIIFQNHGVDLALIGTADMKETFTWSKASPTVMTRSKLTNVQVDAVESALSGNSGRLPTSAAIKTYVDNTLATSGNVFWCTHGSTTDTEIQNALDSNKLPVVVYNGNLYVYYWTTSGYRYFMSFVNNTHSRIMMSQSSSYWGTPTNLLMEQTSNRVTAIDSTAADNKYPSALAVKTYVDNTLSTSGNVFWCTYGTTTASEVQAAIDSGKYPVVKGTGYTLPFITDDGTYYRFCGVNKNTMRAFYLKKDNNVWSDGFWQNAVIETQIKTSISSSSTDTDIPSAKCVYNALSVVPPSYVFDATLSSTTVTLSNSKTIGDLVTAWNNGANEVYIKVNNSKYRISHIALITTGYYYLYTDGIINAMSSAYRSVSYLYVNMSAAEDSNTLLYSSLSLDVPAVVFSATLSGTTVTLSNSKTLNDIYSVYSLSGTKQVYIAVDSNRFAVTRCTKSGSKITLDTAPVHVYTGSHTIRAVYASALAQTSTTLTHYSKTL